MDFDAIDKCIASIEAAPTSNTLLAMTRTMCPHFTMMTETQIHRLVVAMSRAYIARQSVPGVLKVLSCGIRSIKCARKDDLYFRMGTAIHKFGEIDDALEFYRHCNPKYVTIKSGLEILNEMAVESEKRGKNDIAADMFYNLYKGTKRPEMLELATRSYGACNKLRKSLRCLKKFTQLVIATRGVDSEEYAICVEGMGMFYWNAGSYKHAHVTLCVAETLFNQIGIKSENVAFKIFLVKGIIDDPWQNHEEQNHRYRACAFCTKLGIADRTCMPCKGCTLNYYCNDECRKADFESHRAYCNRWSRKYHYCTVCDPQGVKWRSRFKFCPIEGCTETLCRHCACPEHGIL